ncbi:MAG: DoxX family protein [Bacteroidota bacterium]
MKTAKIIFYISTGLLTALMLFSATMYIVNNTAVQSAFTALGYPTYIIYPLAIAKILGVIAIWTRRSKVLTEWAYAGFFYDTLLAASAHLVAQDGSAGGAIVGMILVLVSYIYSKKVFA